MMGRQTPGKKTVLIVGNFLSNTHRTRSVCEDLAERLEARGWRTITTSNVPGRLGRLVDMMRTVFSRRDEYSVAQVDVYSGLSFFWSEATCWLLRRLGKSYVLTLHGGNLPTFSRQWPKRVARLLQSAAAVTTPARYLQHEMRAFTGELRLIPNGIDLNRYPYVRRVEARPSLVWLRAFHRTYNPELVPKVLALLAPDFPDIQITMIGPDKGDGSLQDMQRLASELGVDHRINVAGSVPKDRVPDWLSKGDIFLNTTNVDNTPVSVIEAMACGLDVVSTSVGGIPYLVSDGQDGLLVPPGDAESMSRAVRRLIDDPRLATQLSENARRKAASFDWSGILDGWEQMLLEVAGTAVPAPRDRNRVKV